MHIHDEAPPLNPWPFLAGDAILLATAFLISWQADAPLSGLPLVAITTCVGLGAILAVIPFVLNHTRRQDLALADRQREIAALSQTTASSAEQISIAASNLHTIVEHATRAVKLGESLPHKLQDKINEFKSQLNEVAVTENEALAQEINTLRTSETERLESALTGVRKVAAELSSLESATHKHLKELNDSLTRFTSETGKAASEATISIDTARAAAEKSIAASQTAAIAALQEAVNRTLVGLERKFTGLADDLTKQIASTKTAPASPVPAPENTPAPRSQLPAPGSPPPAPTSKPATTPPFDTTTTTSSPSPEISNIKSSVGEPASITKEKTATRPPHTADAPVAALPADLPPARAADEATAAVAAAEAPAALLVEEKPARKRPPRKPATDDNELLLGIELPEPANEFSQIAPDETAAAVSADGLTRLIVTAYIGIGNKLYVRGEGPGLSWDRGTPLQFVSIGKWRWESADATSPVRVKLYKNDSLECISAGTLSIEPGHQREVSANFN